MLTRTPRSFGKRTRFEHIICGLIIVNAICHIVATSHPCPETGTSPTCYWDVAEYVFLVIYTVEIVVRVYAGGFSRHHVLNDRVVLHYPKALHGWGLADAVPASRESVGISRARGCHGREVRAGRYTYSLQHLKKKASSASTCLVPLGKDTEVSVSWQTSGKIFNSAVFRGPSPQVIVATSLLMTVPLAGIPNPGTRAKASCSRKRSRARRSWKHDSNISWNLCSSLLCWNVRQVRSSVTCPLRRGLDEDHEH